MYSERALSWAPVFSLKVSVQVDVAEFDVQPVTAGVKPFHVARLQSELRVSVLTSNCQSVLMLVEVIGISNTWSVPLKVGFSLLPFSTRWTGYVEEVSNAS